MIQASPWSASAWRLLYSAIPHGPLPAWIVATNFFWSEIDDSIANVTVSTTPALITRQRQNLGAIRARRSVPEHVRVFAAFQNLTGSRYQISSTPVFTVGPPVLFRPGARVSLR